MRKNYKNVKIDKNKETLPDNNRQNQSPEIVENHRAPIFIVCKWTKPRQK